MKKALTIATALFMLAGCAAQIPVTSQPTQITAQDRAMIDRALIQDMKDPSSAQTRNIEGFNLSNGDRVICGSINGKNSFGAYVGFRPFYLRYTPPASPQAVLTSFSGGGTGTDYISAWAADACRDARSGSYSINEQGGFGR